MRELLDIKNIYVEENLLLQKIYEENVSDLYEILSDDKVTEFILPKSHLSIEETFDYYKKIELQNIEGKAIYLGILYGQEKKLVGFVALHNINHTNRSAKIGYVINRNYQRKGLAQKCIVKLINEIYKNTNLVRIEASVNPKNIASIKLLEKMKFTKEGLLRRYSFNPRTEKIEDRIIFSVIKDDIKFL